MIIVSTRAIDIQINNGDNIVKAYLSIPGIKDTLSTTQSFTAAGNCKHSFTFNFSSFRFSEEGSNPGFNNRRITVSFEIFSRCIF